MTEKTLSARGGVLHYWIARGGRPDAPCLVFLHGLTADHTLFDRQAAHFAGDCTVLIWDAPAHGKSRPYAPFSYAHAAELLWELLCAERIARCVLVGQSMGGFVAQLFLRQHPHAAQGFVGIGTCPFGMRYYSSSDLWWVEQAGRMCRMLPENVLRASIARACTHTPHAYRSMCGTLAQYGREELCALIDVGYRQFARELCDIHLPCPVLLLVGEHDITGKVRQYNEAWHAQEGYPLHRIARAAHNANVDNSAQCNRLIRAFVQDL